MGAAGGVSAPSSALSRLAGFAALLRAEGFGAGLAEIRDAALILGRPESADPAFAKSALRSLLCGGREEWGRFDELFETYWLRRGRVRATTNVLSSRANPALPQVWRSRFAADSGQAGKAASTGGADGRENAGEGGDDSEGGSSGAVESRLAASSRLSLARADLRGVTDSAELARAERMAQALARAAFFRPPRRSRPRLGGRDVDLRRTLRRAASKSGEPLELVSRRRPKRRLRLVLLLDVSGSMREYGRFLLRFAKGLAAGWARADVYVFHARLARITDALRDRDPRRAGERLELAARGFGGGTRIGECLGIFNETRARRALGSRAALVIVSDGYDSGPPEVLAAELARARRRARRIVWLNPLLGWRDYSPSARAMRAALPLVDLFAPAHSLSALAAAARALAKTGK